MTGWGVAHQGVASRPDGAVGVVELAKADLAGEAFAISKSVDLLSWREHTRALSGRFRPLILAARIKRLRS